MDAYKLRSLLKFDQALGMKEVPIARAKKNSVGSASYHLFSSGLDKKNLLDEFMSNYQLEGPREKDFSSRCVFGEGCQSANLVFVGEAPGEEEDRLGRPFVGPAGQKLDQMIKAMGFSRDEVWITNLIKNRPPNNRTPLQNEIDSGKGWLLQEIDIINPKIIVALGAPAAKALLSTSEGIGALRGRFHQVMHRDKTWLVMPTYHPAYLLRKYTPETRQIIWSDLQQVMAKLN